MVTRRVNGFIAKVTDSMKHDDVKEELAQAYVDILKKSQLSQIYIDQALSGIFLACPSEAYFLSSKKFSTKIFSQLFSISFRDFVEKKISNP